MNKYISYISLFGWTMVDSNDNVGMKFPLLLSAVMGSPKNCVNKQLVQQRSICVAISLTCGKRETILRAFTGFTARVVSKFFVDLLRPSKPGKCMF